MAESVSDVAPGSVAGLGVRYHLSSTCPITLSKFSLGTVAVGAE